MFNNERQLSIYADQEQVHTLSAKSKSRTVAIEGGDKDPLTHKQRLIAWTCIVTAMLIAITAAWLFRRSILYENTDDARVDGHILRLSTQIDGQVAQVNVIEGQRVHAGDVVAIIDQMEYKVAVYQALANLAYAQATAATLYFNAAITTTSAYNNLNSAKEAVMSAKGDVAAAEHNLLADAAAWQQAQTNVARTNPELVRQAQLVVALDQQALTQAQEKLLQALTNLKSAQIAPQQVSLANAEAQAADLQIVQRKAQLEQAELNLSYTIIRSPITGVVGRRHLEVGQNVRVGQEVIDVVSLDDVWITANFKETQLVHLRPGQPVEIKVDAYGRTWKGHVTNVGVGAGSVFSVMRTNSVIDNHVKGVERIRVRIDFDRPQGQDFNAEGLLKPGLSVEPKVSVRWVPRTYAPSRLPGGRGSTPGPTASSQSLPPSG
jgi:membrane fusion protein (multidrug efflux system)